MRQVQPSKHEPSHQAPLASSNEVSSIPASSRNARPEPRREDSSNRQSSVPGQAPRSRSPVPRKRVPIESITANIQVDAPKSELYLGAQGQGAFGASQETVMKHVGRYPEHAETQRQVPHGSLQDFFGNSRRNLLVDDDEIQLHSLGQTESQSYPPTDNGSTDYLQRRAISPEPMSPLSYEQHDVFDSSNDPYDTSGHHHGGDTRKPKSFGAHHDGRGEKRRATSPVPMEGRSVSPLPVSPTIYPKALPENPAQIHLTAQAKKLAANDVWSTPIS